MIGRGAAHQNETMMAVGANARGMMPDDPPMANGANDLNAAVDEVDWRLAAEQALEPLPLPFHFDGIAEPAARNWARVEFNSLAGD